MHDYWTRRDFVLIRASDIRVPLGRQRRGLRGTMCSPKSGVVTRKVAREFVKQASFDEPSCAYRSVGKPTRCNCGPLHLSSCQAIDTWRALLCVSSMGRGCESARSVIYVSLGHEVAVVPRSATICGMSWLGGCSRTSQALLGVVPCLGRLVQHHQPTAQSSSRVALRLCVVVLMTFGLCPDDHVRVFGSAFRSMVTRFPAAGAAIIGSAAMSSALGSFSAGQRRVGTALLSPPGQRSCAPWCVCVCTAFGSGDGSLRPPPTATCCRHLGPTSANYAQGFGAVLTSELFLSKVLCFLMRCVTAWRRGEEAGQAIIEERGNTSSMRAGVRRDSSRSCAGRFRPRVKQGNTHSQ